MNDELTMSLIVPTLHRPHLLETCLLSITAGSRLPAEIVVVTRKDDVASRAVATKYGATSVEVYQPGAAAAVRAGIKEATSDILVVIDDDARAHPDWLERIHAHFTRDPQLGFVAGRDNLHGQIPPSPGPVHIATVTKTGRLIGNHHLGSGDPRPADLLKGANMAMVSRAAVRIPLDRIVLGSNAQYGFEVFLSLGIVAQGFHGIYDPNVQVDHYPAERPSNDRRDQIELKRIVQNVANEQLAFTLYASRRMQSAHFARTLLIGNRAHPGLAVAIVSLIAGDRRSIAGFHSTICGLALSIREAKRLRAQPDTLTNS